MRRTCAGRWDIVVLLLAVLSLAEDMTGEPSGQNPITYPLGGTVDGSQTVTITWTPTTSGTISLHLLKGPQKDLVDLGAIDESQANTGSFAWSVPSSLEGMATMPSDYVYGLKIIDNENSEFEYSPPFNLSIPDSTYTSGMSVNLLDTSTTSRFTQSTPTVAATTAQATYPINGITLMSSSIQTAVSSTLASSTPSSSSTPTASSIPSPSSSVASIPFSSMPDLSTIIGASCAGLGGLAVVIVVAAVWARLRKEKKRRYALPVKSFRDRAPSMESLDPRSRRILSSSSFGDGARPSEVFEERTPFHPTLSVVEQSPPPTPFAAPPMVFPSMKAKPSHSSGNATLMPPPSPGPPPSPSPSSENTPLLTNPPSTACALTSSAFDFSLPLSNPFTPYQPRSYAPSRRDATWDNHPE